MRHVSGDERRARLAVRHALAPAYRVETPEGATRAMTVLHATEPATVYLPCWARTESVSITDVDRALHADRSLVKQPAMRRTLFVFPRDLLPAVWPSASARVAAAEAARLTKNAEKAGFGADSLPQAREAVLDALAETPGGRSAQELRQAVPLIDGKVERSRGDLWTGIQVLTHLGAAGKIVRGVDMARWYTPRPRWTLMRDWLPHVPPSWSAEEGYRELVRRWLETFGPGTEDDLVWWLGSTRTVVRAALAALNAVAVSPDRGETGYLLPGDLDEVPDPGPWAALPVGCWVQDDTGTVQVRLAEQVSAAARHALDAEAARPTGWLEGFRVPHAYLSPAMKAESPRSG